MSRGKRSVPWISAAAVLILVVGIYLWIKVAGPAATSPGVPVASAPTTTGAPASPPGTTVVPGGIGSPALSQVQADAIGAALASGEAARVASVLAEGVRAEYEASPGAILAPGESLAIPAADVRVTGVGRAVGLVVSHSAAGSTRWALGLVLQDGQWKVLTMVKAGTP